MWKPIIKWAIVILWLLIFFMPSIVLSAQEQRIALVIGNGSYKSSPLANTINDANDMADTLKKCNFIVIKSINATRKEMRKAIREFGREINKGAVGLFYYAGHGIQVGGENYLVPIGAEVYSEDELDDEGLKVSSVLRKMETAGNRLNIIILDACRDNPFGKSFRSSNRGLVKMDAPTGSILAYATSPGSVAADGIGRNGLYTSMLLKNIMTPGLKIESFFKQVRIDVANASSKRQIPWESSSLMGEFYFTPERAIVVEKRPLEKKELYKVEPQLDVESQEKERKKPKLAYIPKTVTMPKVSMRREPEKNLNMKKIKGMLERYYFFDSTMNPNGAFNNDFVDNENDTVTDRATGLMWQKGGSSNLLLMYRAKIYITQLNKNKFAGHSNWRLPTIEELVSLMEKNKKNGVHIDLLFDNKQKKCWSHDRAELTINLHNKIAAWIADFDSGAIKKAIWYEFHGPSWQSSYEIMPDNYVRAVRTVK